MRYTSDEWPVISFVRDSWLPGLLLLLGLAGVLGEIGLLYKRARSRLGQCPPLQVSTLPIATRPAYRPHPAPMRPVPHPLDIEGENAEMIS